MAQPTRTIFRSQRFTQHVRDGAIELADETQRALVPIEPIGRSPVGDRPPPARLHTERRLRLAEEFQPTIEALRALCNGAVETGNPIVWA